MVPSQVFVGATIPSSSPPFFFKGDEKSPALNSHASPSFGNSSNSIPGTGLSTPILMSGDMSNALTNSAPNSGPGVGASSLVTDANSAFRSSSVNTDPYIRLPASPLSFSSVISGSSGIDGYQDQNSQQANHTQLQKGASGSTALPNGSVIPASFAQEHSHLLPMHKKARLDIKQDDIHQQQTVQQLLERQDCMQLFGHNPRLQAFIQQQRLSLQHQQILQLMPQLHQAQLHQQQPQQQLQLRHQLQQLGAQGAAAMKHSFDTGGVCTRRLMQYLYHQRQRPPDNVIAYWKKFVAEFFSPCSKKRCCLSLYNNIGHLAPGIFPQSAMDAWQCNICNGKPGKGFESAFEALPRLNEIKFSSGVLDEFLFLDLPREFRFHSGIMVLECAKAVLENVYDRFRVIREGHLRITFTPDLKIVHWEFCARRHDVLLPRRLVGPQVSQLVQAAEKCQSTVADRGSEGVSKQDLRSSSNMLLAAGYQLAKGMELQSLNDLGFTKRYVRCLQISEVVNNMRDLMDFCKEHNAGPIEALRNYPKPASAAWSSPADRNQPQHNKHNNPQANHRDLLTRQNLTSSGSNFLQPDPSSPVRNPHRRLPSSPYPGHQPSPVQCPVSGLPHHQNHHSGPSYGAELFMKGKENNSRSNAQKQLSPGQNLASISVAAASKMVYSHVASEELPRSLQSSNGAEGLCDDDNGFFDVLHENLVHGWKD